MRRLFELSLLVALISSGACLVTLFEKPRLERPASRGPYPLDRSNKFWVARDPKLDIKEPERPRLITGHLRVDLKALEKLEREYDRYRSH